MDERIIQIRVGIVTVAALILAGMLVMLFGDFPALFERKKTLHVEVLQAPGVTEGTPVRMSGIHIGRVSQVEFQEPAGLRITIQVEDEARIYEGDVCRISESVLGDSKLEFVRTKAPGPAEEPLQDGATVQGRVVMSPLDALANLQDDLQQTLASVTRAGDSFSRAGDQVEAVARQVNNFLSEDPDDPGQLVTKLERAIDNFDKVMIQVNQILGDEAFKGDVRKSFAELPKVLTDTRDTIAQFQTMVDRANRNLKNLESFTEPLGQRGPQIVESIENSVDRLDEVMGQMITFSRRLNDEEGSLSRLVGSPELYDNVSSAARNIDNLTTELRPVIKDLRVFADKVARDPGAVGVSGALQRNRGTKYPNYNDAQPPPADWRTPLR